MVWIPLIIMAAATAVSMYASIKKGESEQEAADYQSRLLRQQALQERERAEMAAETARRRHDRVLGAQRARAAASGIVTTEGSPLLVEMDSELEAALDVARIRWAGEVAASQRIAQARIARFQGGTAAQAGYLGAGASLLSGIGRGYGMMAGGGAMSGTR